MSRAFVETHPQTFAALRYLRYRAGLSRSALADLCSLAGGGGVSAAYLAKIEADPQRVTPAARRRPSRHILEEVLLPALGSDLDEWELLLEECPWQQAVPARTVPEGAEWSDRLADRGELAEQLQRFEQALLRATPAQTRFLRAAVDQVLREQKS